MGQGHTRILAVFILICFLLPQVSGHVYATHKFLLASASPVFSHILQPQQIGGSGAPGMPECVKSHSGSKIVLTCDPDLFEALLHFVYGSHVRINPPAHDDYPTRYSTASANSTLNSSTGLDPEVTPDTSFASVDENDLTTLYDQYAAIGPGTREDPLETQVHVHVHMHYFFKVNDLNIIMLSKKRLAVQLYASCTCISTLSSISAATECRSEHSKEEIKQ